MLEALQGVLPDGFHLDHAAETGSTNDDTKRWLETGGKPQALFIADRQLAGRGRRERTWQSPPGNLYASLVLPKPDDLRTLGHYGFSLSLAICEAAQTITPDLPMQVKWPNDVLIDGAKCAGILIEVAGDGIILGFGVNLQHAPDNSLAGAAYPVASLERWIGSEAPTDFCARVLQAFFALQLLPLGDLLARWKAAAKGVGEAITVNLPDRQLQGVFMDIADDGALLLAMDGGIRPVYSAEIFYRP